MAAHQSLLDGLIEQYNALKQNFTLGSVAFYGGIGLGAWTVYSFAIKPFMSPLRKLPGPGYNPLFGNVRSAMVGEAMDTSVAMVKQYGGVVRFYHLLGRERVLVASPTALRHLLVENVNNYQRGVGVQSDFFGQGIFFSTGDTHKYQRLLMNPVFSHDSVQGYLKLFDEYSDRLIRFWSSQILSSPVINVQNDLKRLTLDIVCKSVFGYEVGSLGNPDSEFAKAFYIVGDVQPVSFLAVIPFLRYLPTKRNRELTQSQNFINKIIVDLIKRKRGSLEGNKEQKDFLSRLILARDEHTGRGLSDEELRSQVLSLLIAGHETTSVTLSWLLLVLASHQDIQDRVREEVIACLPAAGSITWEDLDKLHYTTAVIKEMQRLYPAAPTFSRTTREDDVLDGHFIPAGTSVIYHIGALMRNPDIWPNPESFDPSRFLDGHQYQSGEAQHIYTHMPFATGPHKCLGHQFAKMQIKLVAAKLLRDYKFVLVDGAKFKRKLKITLTPDPPVVLALTKVN